MSQSTCTGDDSNLSAIYTELEPDGLSMWWALDGDSPAASQLDGLGSEKLDKELLGKELHPLDGGDDLADEGDGGSGKGPDCSHVVLSAASPKSTTLGKPAATPGKDGSVVEDHHAPYLPQWQTLGCEKWADVHSEASGLDTVGVAGHSELGDDSSSFDKVVQGHDDFLKDDGPDGQRLKEFAEVYAVVDLAVKPSTTKRQHKRARRKTNVAARVQAWKLEVVNILEHPPEPAPTRDGECRLIGRLDEMVTFLEQLDDKDYTDKLLDCNLLRRQAVTDTVYGPYADENRRVFAQANRGSRPKHKCQR